MKLLLLRHLWGVSEPWETAFPRFKAAGYAGVESALPPLEQRRKFRQLLKTHRLEYIPQIFTHGKTVAEHLDSFSAQVEEARAFAPRFINSHSGRDAFTEEESIRFFDGALEIEQAKGITVAHETHRGRILYNPWVAERMLTRFRPLQLCCDFSHWVCVCERLLNTEAEILARCARHCAHLHARVGFEQGPQVPDPRAPEYAGHLEAHERWWQTIWQAQQAAGVKISTLTPEFGPPPYQPTLPYTLAPVSQLNEICDWQAQRQSDQFTRCLQRRK